VSAAANTPRVDWSTGTPRLLVEPPATNLWLNSAQPTSGSLGSVGSGTSTLSGATALDGTQTAVLFDQTTTSGFGGFYFDQSNNALITGETYCGSVFFNVLAMVSGASMEFGMDRENADCVIEFGSMTVLPVQSTTLNATVAPVGNGWYRLSCAVIATESAGIMIQYVTSTIGFKIALWGWQIENGLSPTSYIPTTSAPVSRAADVIYGV
jgi:hypothetical protein